MEITVDDPEAGFEDELLEREIDIHEDVIQTVVLEGSLASNAVRVIEKDVGDLEEPREDGEDDRSGVAGD